jgi:hypothetical protein
MRKRTMSGQNTTAPISILTIAFCGSPAAQCNASHLSSLEFGVNASPKGAIDDPHLEVVAQPITWYSQF